MLSTTYFGSTFFQEMPILKLGFFISKIKQKTCNNYFHKRNLCKCWLGLKQNNLYSPHIYIKYLQIKNTILLIFESFQISL